MTLRPHCKVPADMPVDLALGTGANHSTGHAGARAVGAVDAQVASARQTDKEQEIIQHHEG